ncbi:MAG TPA: alpha-ketoglutarate-dependent dioxygenase AlkB [Reyranella sp.]|jgi:alkylated DNA repair protein (DNA oxidative demethylase)|nr:alpha-ketoglutarate-dependent dioxygenase AlkB [Reyranella sp.]
MRIFPSLLSAGQQASLLQDLRGVLARAPLYGPLMPRSGTPYSVRMSNCGRLGWLSDQAGYRYSSTHPVTGEPWPAIPPAVIEIWHAATGVPFEPEACLINYYGPAARLGLHRDEDEEAKQAPIVSISLGDTALFRLGGPARKSPTRSMRLASGDVLVLEGPSRDWYHGVDRIMPGTSRLLSEGGRFNLTLRRVTKPL